MAPNKESVPDFKLLLEKTSSFRSIQSKEDEELTRQLDKMSDVGGCTSLNADNGDWSDAKHSDRKKRDRILPDGVVMKLIKKSDYYGFKRLLSNMSLLFLTAYAIYKLGAFPLVDFKSISVQDWLIFVPLYIFYGFQMQCFAFAGGHELLHGNAFKTKWINDVVMFCVGTAFFEVLRHERIMHKQHHTFTLDIDRDPELTSFYSRKELEDLKFKAVPASRFSYVKQFVHVLSYFQHRVMRLLSSSLGIVTDYTGIGWSMKTKREDIDKHVINDLQFWCLVQLTVYIVIFSKLGNTMEGLRSLLFWWIAPCLLGYAPINFFRNAEHADCDFTNNQLHNTRTVESIFFIRWLLWETNFHAEHHAYPMVPFFNLPVIHEMLNDHIKHNETKSFTVQNWKMIRPRGWIDQQRGVSSD